MISKSHLTKRLTVSGTWQRFRALAPESVEYHVGGEHARGGRPFQGQVFCETPELAGIGVACAGIGDVDVAVVRVGENAVRIGDLGGVSA